VLRRDVQAYTDSIPVGDDSPLWPLLERSFPRCSATDWELVRSVIRPEIALDDGTRTRRERGVPTGQPISCVLFNLYLADFDRRFDSITGGFYARYCDDLLFAHPDFAVAMEADTTIDALLAERRLSINPLKSRTLYLTGAGRASTSWPDARGTTSVPFLGCSVSARGTVALGRSKRRRFLNELEKRLQRTARAVSPAAIDEVGPVLCAVVNRALQSRAEFSQARSAALLRRAVTDRRDLRQLDYLIARLVVHAATGEPGVRGFRRVPYRKLREDWGLLSLERVRNRR
jgi:hypothetical protein